MAPTDKHNESSANGAPLAPDLVHDEAQRNHPSAQASHLRVVQGVQERLAAAHPLLQIIATEGVIFVHAIVAS